jgi:hypothetical protein
MLTEHLGAGHEIMSAENMIEIEMVKGDSLKSVEKIDEF